MASRWGKTPRQSVLEEAARTGEGAFVSSCVSLLRGGAPDGSLLVVLAGPAAEQVLAGKEGGPEGYWPRVWAARALLYVFDESAVPALIEATGQGSWRLREMAAKVLGRWRVGEGLEALGRLADDPVARVRLAAGRAAAEIISASS